MTSVEPPTDGAILSEARALLRAANDALESASDSRLEAQRADHKRRVQELEKRLAAARKDAQSARLMYDRLKKRRVVRGALALTQRAKPALRLVKSSKTRVERGLGIVPSMQVRREAKRELAAVESGSTSTRASGPHVTIVVLTRDGAHHLRHLLPGLDRTIYRSFDVIVVDNASTDSTEEVLSSEWRFPLTVVRNASNTSFSTGNNQAIKIATGQYILFLNNDTVPLVDGWLGDLVDCLDDGSVVAAGAVLLQSKSVGNIPMDVQHDGVELAWKDGAPWARNLRGTWSARRVGQTQKPVGAISAATLLARRDALVEVGGFDEGYVYGAEDIDLCLRLTPFGRLVISERSILLHDESSTIKTRSSRITSLTRAANWRRFAETWAPTFTRSYFRERFNQKVGWSSTQPVVAITLTEDDATKGWGDYYTAHELGDAFASSGWTVVYAERYKDRWYQIEHADLVISLLDSYDVRRAPKSAITIAWIRNWVDRWIGQPWIDAYNAVAVGSHQGLDAVSQQTRQVPFLLPLATNPARFSPGQTTPAFESDLTFTGNNWGQGRSLMTALDLSHDDRFLLFGKGWEEDVAGRRYARGHIDYNLLPDVYRSASIVLDDTAGPTLSHGFVNSRVFDALASGALVISNNPVGSEELFSGELPTYSSPAELQTLVRSYLDNDRLRKQTADRLRERVLGAYTYDKVRDRLVDCAISVTERPRVSIRIGVPDEQRYESWGDTHFARSLARGLELCGFSTDIQILPEWDSPAHQSGDVSVHLRGLSRFTPRPGQINIAWIISHPDEVRLHELARYDHVFVASRLHAEYLASASSVPVSYLGQAFDTRRSDTGFDDTNSHELLYVGNSRGVTRQGVEFGLEAALPLTVIGLGWDDLPQGMVVADHVPNRNIFALYKSAGLVIADHWNDMREKGFISNRVYDVLGVGGVIVSDAVAGLAEEFGDLVPSYHTAEGLRSVVDELSQDPARIARIRQEGPELIARAHTFEHRAREMAEVIRGLLNGRRRDLEGSSFSFERP